MKLAIALLVANFGWVHGRGFLDDISRRPPGKYFDESGKLRDQSNLKRQPVSKEVEYEYEYYDEEFLGLTLKQWAGFGIGVGGTYWAVRELRKRNIFPAFLKPKPPKRPTTPVRTQPVRAAPKVSAPAPARAPAPPPPPPPPPSPPAPEAEMQTVSAEAPAEVSTPPAGEEEASSPAVEQLVAEAGDGPVGATEAAEPVAAVEQPVAEAEDGPAEAAEPVASEEQPVAEAEDGPAEAAEPVASEEQPVAEAAEPETEASSGASATV